MEKTIFYFSGTHWDREWYETYQGFRLKLVEVIDDLIALLEENPTLLPFHFDGQTVVFDDYLEVRPEMEARLKKLIADGRILVGPWYCMPDEHLVCGESMIRNLQMGIAKARALGAEPWRCGYICDIFGHTPQFPQILQGFAIQSCVLGRGINEHETRSVFLWTAPDGSAVETLKLPDKDGYGAYSLWVCGQDQLGNRKKPGSLEHEALVREYVDHELERAQLPFAVIWDAMDHEPMHHDIPENIEVLKKLYPDYKIQTGNMLDFFETLRQNREALPVVTNDLNRPTKKDGLFNYLLIHTLSSRQSLKERNDACENLLLRFAEPFCGYLKAVGMRDYSPFLEVAWKNLIMNHPHDSICGCSVDRVHDEMGFRFSQVESICESFVRRATEALSEREFFVPKEGGELMLFSPSVLPVSGIRKIEILLDQDFPTWHEQFGYQSIPAFRLLDAAGREVPYALYHFEENYTLRLMSEGTGTGIRCEVYVPVCFAGREMQRLKVIPVKRPMRDFGKIAGRNGVLENEYISAKVNSDGTVTIVDHRTGCGYPALCGLLDSGEIGDGWNSVEPVKDSIVLGGSVESITIEHSSSLAGEIRVKKRLMLPEGMTKKNLRSEKRVELPVTIAYTLCKGERALRVNMEVENTACDHVLKLMLPVGMQLNSFVTGDTYCFTERKVGIDWDTADWKERDYPERFMRGIALARNDLGFGLAFIAAGGLHECAFDGETMEITLLRAFEKTKTTNGEKGGQELFSHHYSFLLKPLDDQMSYAELQNAQDLLDTPVHAYPTKGILYGLSTSLVGDVCVSSFRGDVLRIYNPNKVEAQFELHDTRRVCRAWLCDLENQPIEELPLEDGLLRAVLPPMKLWSLKLEFGSYSAK